MKYRKKTIVIEAFKYDGDLMGADGVYYVPEWAVNAYENDVMYYVGADMYIKTLEGSMKVNVGDYVIQGTQGEIYLCKAVIFEEIYEKAE